MYKKHFQAIVIEYSKKMDVTVLVSLTSL